MPYDAESRPMKPHSTRTSADRPSTRSASLNAEGTAPREELRSGREAEDKRHRQPADDDDLLDLARGADGAEGGGDERSEQRPDEQCHATLSAWRDG